MIMATLRINLDPWLDFIDKTERNMRVNRLLEIVKVGDIGIREAKSRLPKGKLQESIGNPAAGGVYEMKTTPDMTKLTIGTALEYAEYVERGIPHFYPISPKKGKYLKFYWDKLEKIVYLKKVNHPPVKGKFYMSYAFNMVLREMNKMASRFF